VIAAFLALASGACFAASWVWQHQAAGRERHRVAGDPRLLLGLLRRPLWLLGRGAAVVGLMLQAVALRHGPLATVVPLVVSATVLALPMEARLAGRMAIGAEVRAVLLAAVGLAAFLMAGTPTQTGAGHPDWAWPAVFAAIGAASIGAVLLAEQLRLSSPVAAALLGTATGTLFGLSAVLLKVTTASNGRGVAQRLGEWPIYAYVAVCILAMVLNQSAFQRGSLAAPMTAIMLSESVVAVVVGAAVLGERFDLAGPRAFVVLLGAAGMAVGIWRVAAIGAELSRAG
jgi:hypothetical protein